MADFPVFHPIYPKFDAFKLYIQISNTLQLEMKTEQLFPDTRPIQRVKNLYMNMSNQN